MIRRPSLHPARCWHGDGVRGRHVLRRARNLRVWVAHTVNPFFVRSVRMWAYHCPELFFREVRRNGAMRGSVNFALDTELLLVGPEGAIYPWFTRVANSNSVVSQWVSKCTYPPFFVHPRHQSGEKCRPWNSTNNFVTPFGLSRHHWFRSMVLLAEFHGLSLFKKSLKHASTGKQHQKRGYCPKEHY